MQPISMPICYFPTMTLFLDDRHDALLNFALHLDETLAYRTFDSPEKILAYLYDKRDELGYVRAPPLCRDIFVKNCLPPQTINAALAPMHAEIYNRDRFAEISVIVVDYAISFSEGLAFCSQIDNCNIKKILLIDAADEKSAILACNEGLIDCYIKRNDSDIEEQLRKNIDTLQLAYFKAMSSMILRLLSLPVPNCLHDKAFSRFFLRLRERRGIVEFYLIDQSGGFLTLDEDANMSVLMIKATSDITEAANDKNIGDLPYHYQYTAIKTEGMLAPPQQKICSYHHYLDELDAELFLMAPNFNEHAFECS